MFPFNDECYQIEAATNVADEPAVSATSVTGPVTPAGALGNLFISDTMKQDPTEILNSKKKLKREQKKAEEKEQRKSLLSRKHKHLLERIEV